MEKVALVTGASSGIGRSIAISLAKDGYNVVINYNTNYDGALLTNESLKKYNVNSQIIKCDISNETEVNKMVEEIIANFNHIDVLVNNAGIAIDTTFEDKTVFNFKRILDTNVIGTFLVSKYVGTYMLKNKSGKIINIASTNGIDTYYPESLDYDASKAGVISLTHNLAIYYAPYINVNCICPGWIDTPMNKDMDDTYKMAEEKKILLGHFGSPDDVADLVSFLVSSKSNYINNSIIRVDGGSK